MNPLIEALIALVIFLASIAGAGLVGYNYAKSEAQIEMDKYTQTVNKQIEKLKEENAKAINEVQNDKLDAAAKYQSQLDAANAAYGTIVRLLHDANSNRSHLKAPAAAPAECRSFAAPTTQLSVADADVALAIAKDGDDAIRQLGLCQTEYNSLIARINAE